MNRYRFVHVGVAALLAAATATGVTLVRQVGAAGPGTVSSFVPIVPCRLADTRAPDNVGPRTTPIGPGEVVGFTVWGSNGNCVIPNTATGIATNVTAVNPTAGSFLTIYPSDAPARPLASNLNYTASSAPTPNQVTVALSATGVVSAFNLAGTVDVIIDIVGYYEPTTAGPPGPPGDPDVTAGQVTIASTAWAPSALLYLTTGPGTSLAWPARRATIAVESLTQEVIDRGTVTVSIRPLASQQAWTPLPIVQPTGSGWNRQIEFRYSVGQIDVYFLYAETEVAATQPSISTATLPAMDVRWHIRPG